MIRFRAWLILKLLGKESAFWLLETVGRMAYGWRDLPPKPLPPTDILSNLFMRYVRSDIDEDAKR